MEQEKRIVISHTRSICPVCGKQLPAQRVRRGDDIFLEKSCPEHGDFSTVIWRGRMSISSWTCGTEPLGDDYNPQCPYDCGLCHSHISDTCCVLYEVTRRCNLRCSFCFAEGGEGEDIALDKIKRDITALTRPGKTFLQLSGGEPTVRDDLPEIVAHAKSAGCKYLQLNSNGIRLAEDEAFVAALVEAAKGLSASRLICFSDDEDTLISPAYCFEISVLRECLKMDASDIESYVSCLRKKNMAVVDVYAPYIEGMEIADREDLWCCNAILRREINASLMRKGVTFIDPESAYIDADVRIGMDTVIYPDVYMSGRTVIGEGCRIYNGCRFDNTVVGDNCDMQAVVAIDAVVDDGARVGPYVRLRPNTHIGKNCKIGNFVEIKNSTIGEKTSVAHLTYVGDSDVGSHVNMGCGTVFVNYDGFEKHRCKVGDNVFLGCQTALVAPVTVGDYVYTAAGSVITEDIPAGTLAIARTRQENKEGWVAKYRAIKKKEK